MVVPFAVPYIAGVSKEDGSENYCERTAFQSKWSKEDKLVETRRRKVGFLRAVLSSREILL